MRKVIGANHDGVVDCAGHPVTPVESDFDEMDRKRPAADSCGVETTECGAISNIARRG